MSTTRCDRLAELSRWLDDLSDDELAALEGLRALFAEHGESAPALVQHLSELVRSLARLKRADPDVGGRIQRGMVRHGQKIWAVMLLLAHLAGSNDSLMEALEDDELAILQAATSSLSPQVRGFLACAAEALRDGDLDTAAVTLLAAYRVRRSEVLSAQLPRIVVELR
jgi:hypothetical protein